MDESDRTPALQLKDLERGFTQGDRRIDVLMKACATFYPGETVALLGPSGAGKSTLLHIAGLLEKPDAGRVIINGTDCGALNDNERTRMRRVEVGFVYQFHHLLPEFTAMENVMLPQLVLGLTREEAKARAKALLEPLGLKTRWEHRPAELSGGEQQRVAIARAVANRPKVILADEPTGNLDPHTADKVFGQLMHLVRDEGVAAVIATHNLDLAARMDRVLRLTDGLLVEEEIAIVEAAG